MGMRRVRQGEELSHEPSPWPFVMCLDDELLQQHRLDSRAVDRCFFRRWGRCVHGERCRLGFGMHCPGTGAKHPPDPGSISSGAFRHVDEEIAGRHGISVVFDHPNSSPF